MIESNYWVENYVSSRNAGVHQASKNFEIEVSESVDFNPSIDVYVARGDKMSIQVPKSTKYHKIKEIFTEVLHGFFRILNGSVVFYD